MLTVRDTYQAAFMMAKGFELDHLEPADDGFVDFYFPTEARTMANRWYADDATVPVHGFLDALKRLREAAQQHSPARQK